MEKFAGVCGDSLWVFGDGASAHHVLGCGKSEVEHWGEIEIEAEGAAVLSDDLAVTAKHARVVGGEDFGCGWSCAQYIAKAVDGSAFEIAAAEEWSVDALLTLA
jgi:hypothetical protein